jgi:phosphinothricin acetyltransferase
MISGTLCIVPSMEIRKTETSDLDQVNEIYNWYAEHEFSTFATVTDLEKRREWFRQFGKDPRHLSLVALESGRVVGMACSFAYRGGGVFENTIETSIYVHPEWKGKKIGSSMYRTLFQHLEGTGVHRVVVGIALPNEGSIALHRRFGFTEIGVFDEYAFYKGEYRSSLWMQKKMG